MSQKINIGPFWLNKILILQNGFFHDLPDWIINFDFNLICSIIGYLYIDLKFSCNLHSAMKKIRPSFIWRWRLNSLLANTRLKSDKSKPISVPELTPFF